MVEPMKQPNMSKINMRLGVTHFDTGMDKKRPMAKLPQKTEVRYAELSFDIVLVPNAKMYPPYAVSKPT